MEMRQLQVFVTVADEKGFSAAAQVMGLTQPAISAQIASLEEELGTRLLDRGGRVTTLTRSGEVLYEYARRILQVSREAEEAVHSLKGLLWGEIRLGASTIPGEYILPGLLNRFREAHPGIALEVVIGDSAQVMARVLEDRVEVGVVGTSENSRKLNFTRLVSDRLILIAPVENKFFAGDRLTLEELHDVPVIARESGSGTWTIVRRELERAGIDVRALKVPMVLGSTESVKRAVQCGAGVSFVSERAVRNEVALGLLRAVAIEGVELARDFFVVRRRNKALSPATEALLGFLNEAAEQNVG